MQISSNPKFNWWQASRMLAAGSAIAFVVVAVIFAILLPGQMETGRIEGARWFVFSAFPLMVVVWIAVFTRLQKRLDQIHGISDDQSYDGLSDDEDWQQ